MASIPFHLAILARITCVVITLPSCRVEGDVRRYQLHQAKHNFLDIGIRLIDGVRVPFGSQPAEMEQDLARPDGLAAIPSRCEIRTGPGSQRCPSLVAPAVESPAGVACKGRLGSLSVAHAHIGASAQHSSASHREIYNLPHNTLQRLRLCCCKHTAMKFRLASHDIWDEF